MSDSDDDLFGDGPSAEPMVVSDPAKDSDDELFGSDNENEKNAQPPS